MAVVNVGLQVTLGQVGALASLHDTTHVEGTSLALFDALHWVCAVVEGEAEHKNQRLVTQQQHTNI